ncbi:MAG: hypothetical protein K6B14_01440 [Lachnospiraceae bacterium]|nr:hypothetical protein [Lachnospiraceae bacterium]
MSEMEQQRRQLQQQMQMQQEQQQQFQQSRNLQQNQQQYSSQQTMDEMAIQQNISANAYLQSQRDADAAAPDDNHDELLARQMTVGLGKRQGMKNAHDEAGN